MLLIQGLRCTYWHGQKGAKCKVMFPSVTSPPAGHCGSSLNLDSRVGGTARHYGVMVAPETRPAENQSPRDTRYMMQEPFVNEFYRLKNETDRIKISNLSTILEASVA